MSGAQREPVGIVFDAAARDELAEAVEWYDRQQENLGDEFVVEFKRGIQRIRDFPEAWAKVSPRSRRCRLSRFPYGIIYQSLPTAIRILAVAHLHRRPDYWKNREQEA